MLFIFLWRKSMEIRKIAFCVLLALAVLLAAGCAKKNQAENAVAGEDEAAVETEVPAGAGFGYPMRVGMWLYVIENDTGVETDVTKAVEPLPFGEKLQLVSLEPRRAVNPHDNAIYDYYHVRRGTGREGFAFANQLTVNSVLAVVVDEKANLYRSPTNVDATDYILSRKTVLGVLPETEKDGFIRIEAYDPVRRTYRKNLYIKISTISYRDEDVQSSILLQIAEAVDPEKEANRREALLDAAHRDYPGSVFADEIRVLTEAGSSVPVMTVDMSFRVTDNNVNVRENPNASSPVVTQLANNTEVKAVEATVDEFTIGGQTAQWFHITQPVDGWVFGGWLTAGRGLVDND
jgi:uncharacterized protein YgiM (DUF1202 family)